MTWSIDPPRARAICDATREHGRAILGMTSSLSRAFESARAAVGAGSAAEALSEVEADPFLVGLSAMGRRVDGVIATTERVLSLYEQADYDMAECAQSKLAATEPR